MMESMWCELLPVTDVVVADADPLVVSFFGYKADSEPGDEGTREGGDGL